MKKYLIILIILFSNISQAESCNNNKLSQFLKPMITGDNRILPKQIKYLSGKKLKEFLYNNEITISYYNNKHSYFFYPNFTYDVFSYPYKSRKLIGKGKWELYEGYGIGPGYNRTGKGCDYLYLDGFRSDIRDANFVFLLNKIEIKVVGNIQNPKDYILLKILSITDRKKVDKIISKIKREEDIEKNRLAKLTDLKEKKINALNKIITNNNTNYKKLTEIISIKTEMGKSTDELNSILNDYEKKISDIKTEIVNFDNLKNLENYQILSDFIDPLNNILNQPENNLDKLKSEYKLFKIEEEKRLAEEKRKKIEEEKRLAEEKRKKIEEEKRVAEEKRENEKLALEKKCKNFEVDNSKFDFLGVTPGISWDCFKYTFENRGFYCDAYIENILLGTFSGCEKPRGSENYISFMENKKSIYFTCGSFEGCDRTLVEIAQIIVDKYENKFGASFELQPHFDQTAQSIVYRGSNPKDDQLIEVGTGVFGDTYVLFNQRKSLNF